MPCQPTSRHPTPRTSNIKPNRKKCNDRNTLSERVLARWRCLVAYESPGPPPSGDARGIVPAHRNGHQNDQQSGYILHLCFVCCHPGGCRGDTEPVVARWRRPVASGEALVMLHWAMPHVPLQRLRTAIKMACDGGAFVRRPRLVAWHNRS